MLSHTQSHKHLKNVYTVEVRRRQKRWWRGLNGVKDEGGTYGGKKRNSKKVMTEMEKVTLKKKQTTLFCCLQLASIWPNLVNQCPWKLFLQQTERPYLPETWVDKPSVARITELLLGRFLFSVIRLLRVQKSFICHSAEDTEDKSRREECTGKGHIEQQSPRV